MDSIRNYINVLSSLTPLTTTVNETVARTYYQIPEIANIVSNFAPDHQVNLSRQQIFEEEDIRTKIAKILVWGYPNGMRGDNMNAILRNFDSIVKLCDTFSQTEDGTQLYNLLISVRSLGLSTASKILYFLNARINGKPAVIVDSLVITAFSLFKEFRNLPHPSDRISYYSAVISQISELAASLSNEMTITPDTIELFLFNIGKKWREAQNSLLNYLSANSQLFIGCSVNNNSPIDFIRGIIDNNSVS